MTSLTKVFSLRPEVEFEILKLVLLREKTIKKLELLLQKRTLDNKKPSSINVTLIGYLDILRDVTVDVIETIRLWEQTQFDFPKVIHPFLWNGLNYLEKAFMDLKFLDNYTFISEWLGNRPSLNPFVVPNEILDSTFHMQESSFVVFGMRPSNLTDKNQINIKKNLLRSPYLTPVINDPVLIPTLSVENKLKKLRKLNKSVDTSYNAGNDKLKDPYEIFLSFGQIEKIRNCWEFLTCRYGAKEDMQNNVVEKSNITAIDTSRTANTNEYLRIRKIRYSESNGNASVPYVWTPHDRQIIKAIQKRGGELAILTAAGTKGRINAPRRKNRYERLEVDHQLMKIEYEVVCMRIEDILSHFHARRNAVSYDDADFDQIDVYQELCDMRDKLLDNMNHLEYQIKSLRSVSLGSISSKDKQIIMKQLAEGQVNPVDEQLSVQLEHKMASKIQRLVLIFLSRNGRRVVMTRLRDAAVKIQSLWRRYHSRVIWSSRSRNVQFAVLVQKYYRRWKAKGTLKQMRLESRKFKAAVSIQRIYRGYDGRRRFVLRKEFLQNISDANRIVSSYELVPVHIDALGDEIESYLSSTSNILSVNIMSILRGIYYMLNGDQKTENVIEYRHGNLMLKAIATTKINWYSMLLILRRKGRLLRRIRGLARSVATPNPIALKFGNNCVSHLLSIDPILNSAATLDISGDYFGLNSKLAKECVLKLSLFSRYMIRIHQLQNYFPIYFKFTHEHWFKALLLHQKNYEKASTLLYAETLSQSQLEQKRDHCVRTGKKLGPILTALKLIGERIVKLSHQRNEAKKALNNYIENMMTIEKKRLFILQNTDKTITLGINMAIKELDDYKQSIIRLSLLPSATSPAAVKASAEPKIKELEAMVDRKELSLIEVRSKIQTSELEIVKKESLTKYTEIISLDRLKQLSHEYSYVLSEYIVLQQIWDSFVKEIGGIQYGYDLIGEKLLYFQNLQSSLNNVIKLRDEYLQEIDNVILSEFKKFDQTVLNTKTTLLMNAWDIPNRIEAEAEKNEDYSVGKRDANRLNYLTSFFQAVSLNDNSITVPTSSTFYPVLLLVDCTIPDITKTILFSKLSKLKFKLCQCDKVWDGSVFDRVQEIIDESHHPILPIFKGYLTVDMKRFYSTLKTLIAGLSKKPRVIYVDYHMRIEPWHTLFSVRIPSKITSNFTQLESSYEGETVRDGSENTNPSMSILLCLGKLRHISGLFRRCLVLNSRSEEEYYRESYFVPKLFREKFRLDYADIIQKLKDCMSLHESADPILGLEGATHSTVTFSKDVLENYSIMSLIASFTTLCGLWNSPSIGWASRHLKLGSKIFLDLGIDRLCDLLFLEHIPQASFHEQGKLNQIKRMNRFWGDFSSADFNIHPVKVLLASWCQIYINIMEIGIECGGMTIQTPFADAYNNLIHHTLPLRWYEDICSDDLLDEFIGNLIDKCFDASLILDDSSISTIITFNQYNPYDKLHRTSKEGKINRHVRIYHHGSDVYLGVYDGIVPMQRQYSSPNFQLDNLQVDNQSNSEINNIACMHVTHITTTDIHAISCPTGVEMHEGYLSDYRSILAQSKRDEKFKWLDIVTNWIRYDEVVRNDGLVAVSRNRYLLTSQLGFLNGYNARIEIMEDRNYLMLVYIHGILPDNDALVYHIDRKLIDKLTEMSDNKEEKTKLETYDTYGVALIIAGRLTIQPSRRWVEFLKLNMLTDFHQSVSYKASIRFHRGPGRYMGSTYARVHCIDVMIVLYEIIDDFDAFGLRLIIYNMSLSISIEYRLSALERVMLFNHDSNLLQQIIERIQVSYCDISENYRLAIPFEYDYDSYCAWKHSLSTLVIYGDREYSFLISNDEDTSLRSSSNGENTNDFEKSEYEHKIKRILTGSDDNSIHSKGIYEESSNLPRSAMTETNASWRIFFNRCISVHHEGNLTISVNLNTSLKGFTFFVLDRRTYKERCKFVSFAEYSDLVNNMSMEMLEQIIHELNEDKLHMMLESVLSLIDIISIDQNTSKLVLKSTNSMGIKNDITIMQISINECSGLLTRKPKLQQIISLKFIDVVNFSFLSVDSMMEDNKRIFCRVYLNDVEFGVLSFVTHDSKHIFEALSVDGRKSNNILKTYQSIHIPISSSKIEIRFILAHRHGDDIETTNESIIGQCFIIGKQLDTLFQQDALQKYPIVNPTQPLHSFFDEQSKWAISGYLRLQGKCYRSDELVNEFVDEAYVDGQDINQIPPMNFMGINKNTDESAFKNNQDSFNRGSYVNIGELSPISESSHGSLQHRDFLSQPQTIPKSILKKSSFILRESLAENNDNEIAQTSGLRLEAPPLSPSSGHSPKETSNRLSPTSPKLLRFQSGIDDLKLHKPLVPIIENHGEDNILSEDASPVKQGAHSIENIEVIADSSAVNRSEKSTLTVSTIQSARRMDSKYLIKRPSSFFPASARSLMYQMTPSRYTGGKSPNDTNKQSRVMPKYQSNILTIHPGKKKFAVKSNDQYDIAPQEENQSVKTLTTNTNTLFSDDSLESDLNEDIDDSNEEVSAIDIDDEASLFDDHSKYVEKRLDLHIVKGINFPRPIHYEVLKSIVFVIKIDGYETNRCSILSNVVDDKSGVAEFGNEPFSIPLRLPKLPNDNYSLSDFVLEIELWHSDINGNPKSLLGLVDIRGDKLDEFVCGKGYNSSWFHMVFSEQSLQDVILENENEMEEQAFTSRFEDNASRDVSPRSVGTLLSFSGLKTSKMPSQSMLAKGASKLFSVNSLLSRNQSTRSFQNAQDNASETSNGFLSPSVSSMNFHLPTESGISKMIFKHPGIGMTSTGVSPVAIMASQLIQPIFNQQAYIELQGLLSDLNDPLSTRDFEINSIAFKNLCYYDSGGNEVGFIQGIITVTVLFNKRPIKTMRATSNAIERSWSLPDRIKLILHGKRSIKDCKLEFQVFEGDIMKLQPIKRLSMAPLGVTVITGNDLIKLLTPSNSQVNQKKPTSKLIKATILASGTKGISSSFELHPPDIVSFRPRNQGSRRFHGLLELQGKIIKDDDQIASYSGLESCLGSRFIEDQRKDITRLLPGDYNNSIIRQINNQEPDFIHLQLLNIKSLSSDFFGNFFDDRGKSCYIVKVFLNGQFIARTKLTSAVESMLQFTNEPAIDIILPRGHELASCRLVINLYEVIFTEGENFSEPKFICKTFLEGNDLSTVLTELSPEQYEAIQSVNKSRELFEGAFSPLTSGKLEVNDLPFFPCRVYDHKEQDFPLSIEVRGWRKKQVFPDIRCVKLVMTDESILHRRFKPIKQYIDVEILAVKNIVQADKSLNPYSNIRSGLYGGHRFVSPPESPTFTFARVGVANDFLIEVRWNKQRVYQYQGLSHTRLMRLYVPWGYHVKECKLQIIFWSKGKCLGEANLHQDQLVRLLNVPMKDLADESTENNNGLWCSLTPCGLVPSMYDGFNHHAMVELRGRLFKTRIDAKPIDQTNKKKNTTNLINQYGFPSRYDYETVVKPPRLFTVQSFIDENKMTWRYYYDPIETYYVHMEKKRNKQNIRLPIERPYSIEYAPVERGVIHVNQEEDRICWRGRVKPKNFINNTNNVNDEVVFMPRSRKLIHLHSVITAKVEAEISYLKEFNVNKQYKVADDKLPIMVREILSEGPGLIRRHFRVDVSTNTGTKIGTVDLFDTYEDMRDILGRKHLELLDGPRDQWNMTNIFEYIVEHRIVIEMIEHFEASSISRKSSGFDDTISESSKSTYNTRRSKQHNSRFLIKLIRDSDNNAMTFRSIHQSKTPTSLIQKSVLTPASTLTSIRQPNIAYPESNAVSASHERSLDEFYLSLSGKISKLRPKTPNQSPKHNNKKNQSSSPTSKQNHEKMNILPSQMMRKYSIHNNLKMYWIKISSKIWKMAGNKYNVVVLFTSEDNKITSNPDDFFDQYKTGIDGLYHVMVIFRCRDSKTGEVSVLNLPGFQIAEKIDPRYHLNLSTKYRREKFGYFLTTYLNIVYHADGKTCDVLMNLDGFHLSIKHLIKMKQENITSVDNSNTKPRIHPQSISVDSSTEKSMNNDSRSNMDYDILQSPSNAIRDRFDELDEGNPDLDHLNINNSLQTPMFSMKLSPRFDDSNQNQDQAHESDTTITTRVRFGNVRLPVINTGDDIK